MEIPGRWGAETQDRKKEVYNEPFGMRIFCMCSLYPKNERAICACFLGKNSSVVRDMKKLRADALLWAAMVSGSISLHDLEEEAYGERFWDPEGRADKDFILECERVGIKVFSVIFTAQGYEIGREFGRWGLNEFHQNRYPFFKKWEDYFGDSEKVDDFISNTACRNIHGEVLRALWTQELPEYFDMETFYMCKNSPYWMKYLKKIIELQIDAGTHGILFDESGAPFDFTLLGGGFCKYCMQKFEKYFVKKYGKKYEGFNYAEYLKKLGYGLGSLLKGFDFPFGEDFKKWQFATIRENFKELVDHARKYAEEKGRKILITGNFAELLPQYFHLVDLVDIFNFEIMLSYPPEKNTAIYILARTLARGKPVTAVPTILNSVDLRERKKKIGTANLERYFIAEAASMLVNYQIPYSCYTITGKGAYYPDVDEIEPYQAFIADNDFYGEPVVDVSVVFSFPSYLKTFTWVDFPGSYMREFLSVEKELSGSHITYDFTIFGDGFYLDEVYAEGRSKNVILIDDQITEIQQGWLRGKNIVEVNKIHPSIPTNLPRESIFAVYERDGQLIIHILNCSYLHQKDEFVPLKDVKIGIGKVKNAELHSPDRVSMEVSDGKIRIPEIPLYCVVVAEI